MSKNDTGVFQLDNGYWGYRYAIRIDGKSRESKKVKDEFGNPFKTKSSAAKARQQAIMNEKINAATPQVKRPRKKVSEVYNEYCEFGRAGKAYSTIKKQDSLWNNHIKSKFGKRYVDDISVAEINDYLAELYYTENRAYSYVESFLKVFYLIFGQAYSRNYLNAEQYDKLCKNKDTKIHMPKMKIDEDTDIVTSSDEQMITLSEYFTEIAFLGKPLTKPIVKPLGLFFCIFFRKDGAIYVLFSRSGSWGVLLLLSELQ